MAAALHVMGWPWPLPPLAPHPHLVAAVILAAVILATMISPAAGLF